MLSTYGRCSRLCTFVFACCTTVAPVVVRPATAQTPWATAPATPAALPAEPTPPATTQTPSTQVATPPGSAPPAVVRLPTPPPRHSWPSSVSMPASVPLSAARLPAGAGLIPNHSAVSPTVAQQLGQISTTNLQVPKLSVPALPDLASVRPVAQTPMAQRPSSLVPPSAIPTSPLANSASRLVAYSPGQDVSEKLDAGQLIAVVGEEHILAGDMSVFVEPVIQQNKHRIDTPEKEAMARAQLTRQVLKEYISIKANYQEFFRDAVGTKPPDEIIAVKEKVIPSAAKAFYKMQVPVLLKKYDVVSIAELQKKLAEKSLSLETMRKQFIEQALGAEYERKYVPQKFDVDHYELLQYYREHEADWNMPARAKWRQVTIRFDKHDRATARALIDNLLKQIYLGGKSFAEVAKQDSEGFTAQDGGIYDWTTKGSLKSKQLDQAIFSLPTRQLSAVIEDEIGYHFIEVLEREDEHIKDFANAQVEIRKLIVEQKRNEARDKLREKVLARTAIWTRWPEDLPGLPLVRPLEEALAIPGSK